MPNSMVRHVLISMVCFIISTLMKKLGERNIHNKDGMVLVYIFNYLQADNLTYFPDPQGSIHSYRYLLGRVIEKNYQIHLYNGNWDFIVPYSDTISNIKDLNLKESYL